MDTQRQNKITHIGQLLPEMLKEPVPFEMIDLTDLEKEQALKDALVKKYASIERQRKELGELEKQNDWKRQWAPNDLYDFARERATDIVRGETGNPNIIFEPKDFQKDALLALTLYFSDSEEFEKLDVKKYNTLSYPFSLQKGLWLWGNPGVGKTLLMKMFSKNKSLCFRVVECPKIVSGYVKSGEEHISHYSRIIKSDVKAYSNFFQEEEGVCYNDLCIESLQAKHYGTGINVMEQILLDTYEAKVPFFHRHVTTNLIFDQVKEKYGVRITDRVKQCFNVIEIKGESVRGVI
jgi:DNA replication protein DnaC